MSQQTARTVTSESWDDQSMTGTIIRWCRRCGAGVGRMSGQMPEACPNCYLRLAVFGRLFTAAGVPYWVRNLGKHEL